MPSWSDLLVLVPFVGTIKCVVECGDAAYQGDVGRAAEKFVLAGIGLALDVAFFGTPSGTVVTAAGMVPKSVARGAGKTLAKHALRRAAQPALNRVAQRQMLQLAAIVGIISTSCITQQNSPIERTHAYEQPTTTLVGRAPETEAPSDPGQGHHVINKGVLKLIKKIVDRFLKQCNLPEFNSLEEHLRYTNARVHRAYKQPLDDPKTQKHIKGMVYHGNRTGPDDNAEKYGNAQEELVKFTVDYMKGLFYGGNDIDGASFREHVKNMKEEIYVDEKARDEYLKKEKRKGQRLYDGALLEVGKMFETLITELELWVRELKDAADALTHH